MTPQDKKAAARLRRACELHRFGMAMMRQNIRRKEPHLDDAAVHRRLLAWLLRSPDVRDEHHLSIRRPRDIMSRHG